MAAVALISTIDSTFYEKSTKFGLEEQWGAFSKVRAKTGEKLFDIKAIYEKKVPDMYTIMIAPERHILVQGIERMNHECDPNVHVNIQQMGVFALKDIEVGDELTFNYLSTEYNMNSPFPCGCHAGEKCFGYISGWKHLNPEQRDRVRAVISGEVSPALLELDARNA